MMSFDEIDALRAQHGITRKAIYTRAKINGETWRRIARRDSEPNTRTLKKLTDALNAMIEEQGHGHHPQ